MIPNISFKQLSVFNTISQHTTLTAAAKHLFMSKAAVSMALSELEKQLGQPLFDRVNKRLILNQEGKKLRPLADELLRRAMDIKHLFSDDHPLTGQLKIGSSNTIGNHISPYLISQFRQQTQHFSQHLSISNSTNICQKLLDFELDLALIESKVQHNDLIFLPFSSDEMCLISANDHPLTKLTNIKSSDLENSDWVLRELGSGSRQCFINTLAPTLKQWHLALQLNSTEALINSVSAGLGLGCLSTLAAEHAIAAGRVSLIQTPVKMPRTFYLVIHKNKYQSPLIKKFMAFCKQW
ncbi:LysR family transcriptional regulator [Psychromonas sp. CNPT3]|uniref:LysR substrate-binding domain-containing protein n=1 Tax=Psychromonas sp. CNPT3 TaxID=314282 RepID=UPI00006E428F|nr:LysR substrate-binding domain-containing protein [Psychromonas sp. CNPT3]AGH80882.1 LysR family transcriptional regulator [Psychromonas sp. CNPT3]